MRKLWITILLLSVSFIAVVAPMYAEGHVSVADKKNTTSTTSTMTETSSPEATGTEGDFYLKVDPPSHTVKHLENGKSRSATYSVKVTAISGFQDEVQLSVKGLPKSDVREGSTQCLAFFNPEEGMPKPVLTSVLKVIVPPSAPSGVYILNITGGSDEAIRYATTTLIIEGEATTSTVTTSATKLGALKVSVLTDQKGYQGGEDVVISGYVRLSSGASAADVTVSLSVLAPGGGQIHAAAVQSNEDGRFAEDFALPSAAVDGIYTVYATASMSGYRDVFAAATFTVGVSDVPSVHIVEASITMPNGTLSSEFLPGQTAVVWAVVNNTGADLVDGNTWVEVLDPDNSPITLVALVVTIHTGEQVKVGVHVILASDAKFGVYVARILVSDRPIVTGGKFLDSKETAFLVTAETSPTTTTQVTSQTTTETSTSTSETTATQTTSETTSTTSTQTTSQTSTTETSSQTNTTETTSETSTTEPTSETSTSTSVTS